MCTHMYVYSAKSRQEIFKQSVAICAMASFHEIYSEFSSDVNGINVVIATLGICLSNKKV